MVSSQAIIISVPAVAGGAGLDLNGPMIEATPTPSRKRRLGHLTMEEKVYRKKLKNRVAAQTSRDRKKARMDELESSVCNMASEIESLKRINEKVTAENVLLKTQLQDMQATNAALLETLLERSPKGNTQAAPVSFPSNMSRPAEGTGRETSRLPEQPKDLTDGIPSLPELLADLRPDEDLPDLGDLERFAESLLQEALASEELSSDTYPVVGKTSEVMESSGYNATSITESPVKVEVLPVENIPQNISRPPRKRPQSRQPRQNQKRAMLKVQSKVNTEDNSQQDLCFPMDTLTCMSVPRKSSQPDILASAFNEAMSPSDCITIIVPTQDDSGDCIFLGEAVQEVTTSSFLMPPFKDEPLSPRSDITETVRSDSGYESFGSPHSDISSTDAMSDLWNESFSQLFPNLS